jgi:hypothetical protein
VEEAGWLSQARTALVPITLVGEMVVARATM